MILKLGIKQLGLNLYIVNIIDDPWLTMTYLTARSNGFAYRLYVRIGKTVTKSFNGENLH